MARLDLVSYLAECHVEFILNHPFREGNGHLSRLLSYVLSVLAGKDLLHHSLWKSTRHFTSRQYKQVSQSEMSPGNTGDIL